MENHDPIVPNDATGPDPEKSVTRLLQLAGERMAPRSVPMERARAAAHESWQGMLAQRSSGQRAARRTIGWAASFAAAASVVLAVILYRSPAPDVTVARFERVEGSVRMELGGRSPVIVRDGMTIPAGGRLLTRDALAALSLGESLSLRMNRNTTLDFGEGAVTLRQGAIYVDTGHSPARSFLRIVTPAGEVRHVGTQFQVLVEGDKTVVRVREGRVRIDPLDGARAAAGDVNAEEEIVLVPGEVAVRRAVSPFGPEWGWSAEIAPPFAIEGRSLAELLGWVIRENGWQLAYATPAARSAAGEVRLHGGPATAPDPQTLARIAAITGFSLSSQDGVLRVSDAR